MQSAKATWNDERLDELAQGVRDLRVEMKSGDEALRAEMKSGDEAGRAVMMTGFNDLQTRLLDLERTIRWFGGLTILMLAGALLEGRF